MNNILTAVGLLVQHVVSVVPQWMGAFIKSTTTTVDGLPHIHQSLSVLGIFCIGLPLIGLGIGIIKRLVKVRA